MEKIVNIINPVFMYIVSGLMGVAFIVQLAVDYFVRYEMGSAPFYLYVIERCVEYLLPAILFMVIGIIVKNKKTALQMN